MSRYLGFGLALITVLLLGGCSDSEPDAPQPSPPASVDTPAVEPAADDTPSAVPAEEATPESAAMDSPAAEAPAEETKPTVLGAIGKAVAGAVGASGNGPSEAPAYQPPE